MINVYVGLNFYRVRSDKECFNDFNINVKRSKVPMTKRIGKITNYETKKCLIILF